MASAPKYKTSKPKAPKASQYKDPRGPKPAGKANIKVPSTKPPVKSRTNRSMNALDKAISEGKTLPSKNKKYPGELTDSFILS